MPSDQTPELSIIVPVLNEAAELASLLENLAGQEKVTFELILSDGGSSDKTPQLAAELATGLPFTVRCIRTSQGRGRQMNAGAAIAAGELLLFLHADSRFREHNALNSAVSTFRERLTGSGSEGIAARFSLCFRRSDHSPSLAYFFYEAKARLNRDDCIRGDQGFLLTRSYFHQLGGFDQSLPYLEDIRLVALVARKGAWCLLPAEISTSARRFETEGLYERQVVNAIIVNNSIAEWTEFFDSLPGLYHCNAGSGRLQLYPLLEGIRGLIARQPLPWRQAFWLSTGRHVAANSWQLFFWLDARRAFRTGKGAEEVETGSLDFYQRRLEPLFQTRFAAWLAQLCVRLWFRWKLFKKQ